MFFSEIPFLAYLAFTEKERGVARWDPAHVNPRVKSYIRVGSKILKGVVLFPY